MGIYRVGAGIFAIDKNGNIFLLKRSRDTSYPLTWSLPGGSMENIDCDNLEFPKQEYKLHEYLRCAIRETAEETAIYFKEGTYSLIKNIFSNSLKHTYKYMTFVILYENILDILDNVNLDLNENIDYKIFTFEELKKIKRHNEEDKNKLYDLDSIHPGLFDIIEEIENEINRYFKKFK